jgi:hypothetical protein
MSNDHKISSLYNKLTTLKQPELNDAVKNLHSVILTLCRVNPTYFISINNAIKLTKTFLSKLNDDAIIKYINTPALLSIFHSRYHKDIESLLFTLSKIFPFLLEFYDHVIYALNYLDSKTYDQKGQEKMFFIIQIIKEFGNLSTEDKVYVLKRILMLLNQSVSLLSELSESIPVFGMSKEVTTDVCKYLSDHPEILNNVVVKIESVGIDRLLDKGITSLDALINIVENSKGAVMTRDSRYSISSVFVTPVNSPVNSPVSSPVNSPVSSPVNSPVSSPVNSPVNSPKVISKKGFGGTGKIKRRKYNKQTKKRKPKHKTRK